MAALCPYDGPMGQGMVSRNAGDKDGGDLFVAPGRGTTKLLASVGADARPWHDAAPGNALVVTDDPSEIARLAATGARVIAVTDTPTTALAAGARFVSPDDPAWIAATVAIARRAHPDRRAAPEPAEAMVATALAGGDALTVLHIRLARLDLINRAHGREAGTALVDAAERRILALVAGLSDEEGAVARVAGPGFVVALPGAAEAAIIAAARLEEALARPFRLGAAAIALGSRIGIAGARDGEDAGTLLARAARSAAEPAGEGGTVIAATMPAADTIDQLAADLHHALDRGEIRILYQPQADIAGVTLTGVEALARWQHPQLGPLGAGDLFAAAERAEIGLALSDHIQGLVLESASRWPASLQRLRVSVNLTAGDLARPRFVDRFLARVDASGFPRGRLTLEITETGLMADLDAAALCFAELRGAGCRIAIDDFGTGYSSLAYLKSLPVDYVKLDKALIDDLDREARDRVVAAGTIDMARSLGLAVIAEGVEDEGQRRQLATLGCALYQGFLLAEPLDEAALIAFVEGYRR